MKHVCLLAILCLGLIRLGFAQSALQIRFLSDTVYEYGYPNAPVARAVITGTANSDYIEGASMDGPGEFCWGFGDGILVSPQFLSGGSAGDTVRVQDNPYYSSSLRPEGRFGVTLTVSRYPAGGGFRTLHHIKLPNAVYYKRFTPLAASPPVTVTPLLAEAGQTLDVTITAPNRLNQASSVLQINFNQSDTAVGFTGISGEHGLYYANSFTATGPHTAVANITVPANTPPGRYDILVNHNPIPYNYFGPARLDSVCYYQRQAFVVTAPTVAPGQAYGTVYADQDSNCAMGYSDSPREHGLVKAVGTGSTSGTFYGLTGADGRYRLDMPLGSYLVQAVSVSGQPVRTCRPPRAVVLTTAAPVADSLDFADSVRSDVFVALGVSRQRPGRDFQYYLYTSNGGEDAQYSRSVLEFDTLFTYVPSASDTSYIDSVRSNRVYFKQVLPLRSSWYYYTNAQYVTLSTPGRAGLLGRQVAATAYRLNAHDQNAANDTAHYLSTIVSSLDPNDKSVSPSELATADQELHYAIRFQNTGTDTAFSIVVQDTLSPLLDIATVGKFTSLHPARFNLLPGRVLEARFDNILLPDSNVNERGSHGSFGFSAKPIARLAQGETIRNQASIYFDYNDPVPTNTVSTQLATPVAIVAAVPLPQARWVPNPASENILLKVAKAPIGALYAIDAAGRQTALIYSYIQGDVSSNVAGLLPGVYQLRFADGTGAGRVAVAR